MGLQPAAGLPEPAPTRSSRLTRTSTSRSPSTAGTTTGASSPTGSSPARARRVHRPPGEVPGVREPGAAGPAGRHARPRTASTSTSYQPGPGRPVDGPGRQALRPAQGLRHRRLFYNKELIDRRRRHEADLQNTDLEPHRRRHVREDDRPPDGRQERQARRRARLRQDQGQGLRLGPGRRLGRRQSARPSGACTPARNDWQFTDKNPWGTHYNYDEPDFPGDHQAGSPR